MKSFVYLMYLGKHCLMQYAVSKSLAMMIDVKEMDKNLWWALPLIVRPPKRKFKKSNGFQETNRLWNGNKWPISEANGKNKAWTEALQVPKSYIKPEEKLMQLQRCWKLLGHATSQHWERFIFTNEKLLTIQQAHNSQNYRTAPSTLAIVEHCQNPKLVMIWDGICASDKTPLFFVDEGIKK